MPSHREYRGSKRLPQTVLAATLCAASLAAAADPAANLRTDPALVAASSANLTPTDTDASPAALRQLRFQDSDTPKRWLGGLRRLSLVTFWQGRHASVFLGVNRNGQPGLHLQRRDPGETELPSLQLSGTGTNAAPAP